MSNTSNSKTMLMMSNILWIFILMLSVAGCTTFRDDTDGAVIFSSEQYKIANEVVDMHLESLLIPYKAGGKYSKAALDIDSISLNYLFRENQFNSERAADYLDRLRSLSKEARSDFQKRCWNNQESEFSLFNIFNMGNDLSQDQQDKIIFLRKCMFIKVLTCYSRTRVK